MSYPYQQNFPGAGGPEYGYSSPPPPGQGQYQSATSPPQQPPWGPAPMTYNASPSPPGQAPNWQPYGYPPYNTQQAPPPPGPGPSPYPNPGYGSPGPMPYNNTPSPFTSPAVPAPTPVAPISISYPYLLTAKRQMTLFTPDRSRAIFTVHYPDTMSFSWSKSRTMKFFDGTTGKEKIELGGAEFHSFTTEKVDLTFRGRTYRFKKKFVTQTGLLQGGTGTGAGTGKGNGIGEFTWQAENGELWFTAVAADEYKDKEKEKEKGEAPILARFVPRDGAVGGTNILEGRLELRMEWLSEDQFGEVFVTFVVEMERRRKSREESEIVASVVTA